MKRWEVILAATGLVWSFVCASCKNEPEAEDSSVEEAESYVLAKANALPPEGATGVVRGVMTMTNAPLSLKVGEKPMVGTMSMRTEKEMIYDVISPTKVKILVAKDTEMREMSIGGQPQPSPAEVSPIQGEALTFEFQDGAWQASLDSGADLSEEQAEKTSNLSNKLSSKDSLGIYGSEPRKVGESWQVDPDNIPGMGSDSDFEGTYKLTFDRVEDFGGQRCAVLLGRVDVLGAPPVGDGQGTQVKINAATTTYRSLDYLEDLKLEIDGEMTISGSPQPGVSMMVRGPFKMEQTSELQLP